MTHRDQQEFKIRKLTRAIDAIVDLGADFNLTAGVVETLRKLRQKRADIRRDIATGRRSCGECGHPMVPGGRPSAYIPEARQTFHMCATDGCDQRGRTIDDN